MYHYIYYTFQTKLTTIVVHLQKNHLRENMLLTIFYNNNNRFKKCFASIIFYDLNLSFIVT